MDIYFFKVNTKYISLSELKTSELSRVYENSEIMKRGLFGPVTYVLTKNMTAKVAKPIKNGRKQGRLRVIEFHFF